MNPPGSARLRIGILGSTRGTASQAVFEAIAAGTLHAEVALVIANKADAPILTRAARYGAPGLFVSPKGLAREAYDAQVSFALQQARADVGVVRFGVLSTGERGVERQHGHGDQRDQHRPCREQDSGAAPFCLGSAGPAHASLGLHGTAASHASSTLAAVGRPSSIQARATRRGLNERSLVVDGAIQPRLA